MSGPADPKPASSRRRPAASREDREARLRFKVATLAADGRCVAHDDPDDCDGDFVAHHAITQQQLRKAGLHDEMWNPQNGATVCERAHRRHHRGVQRIRWDQLPERCLRFARLHDLIPVLERFYAPALPARPAEAPASMRA